MTNPQKAFIVFVVGATLVNLLWGLRQSDQIGWVEKPTPAPTASGMDFSKPPPSGFVPDSDLPDPLADITYNYNQKRHRELDEQILIQEVGLITIAGMAWFLVRAKA